MSEQMQFYYDKLGEPCYAKCGGKLVYLSERVLTTCHDAEGFPISQPIEIFYECDKCHKEVNEVIDFLKESL